MTWPASDVSTVNMDAGVDNPATARLQLLDLAQKFNQLRNHVTAFAQGLLAAADAAAARLTLGLANHQLLTMDTSGNASTSGTVTAGGFSTSGSMSAGSATVTNGLSAGSLSTGGTLTAGNSTINGNLNATGAITASGNVTGYSDERLKDRWADLPAEFVERLASVKAGTFCLKGQDKRYAGVSAQSLQGLLPEAVECDEEGLLSVAYGNAALVACIALAQEVVDLRHQVAQLRGER